MRVWSLQNDAVARDLIAGRNVHAEWEGVPAAWRPAYEWMVQQMSRRGVPTHGSPPIWGWHPCGSFEHGPTADTVGPLFGGSPWEGVILTLEIPKKLVVLSDYGRWCDLIDLCLGLAAPPPALFADDTLGTLERLGLNPEVLRDARRGTHNSIQNDWANAAWVLERLTPLADSVFQIPVPGSPQREQPEVEIQACLPYLDPGWMRDVQHVRLEVDDDSWEIVRGDQKKQGGRSPWLGATID
jgi:hypothetical protein